MVQPACYEIDDPRINAARAPYTYFLPSPERVALLLPGDLAKLVIRPVPGGRKYDAERMWIKITKIEGENLFGLLDNQPFDIPSLDPGAPVAFKAWHVIECIMMDPARDQYFQLDNQRDYYDRCMVDQCVLDGETKVGFLYREEPDLTQEGDKYPDSGWRIRGDLRNLTDEDIDAREVAETILGFI
jgi:hypothetical protein